MPARWRLGFGKQSAARTAERKASPQSHYRSDSTRLFLKSSFHTSDFTPLHSFNPCVAIPSTNMRCAKAKTTSTGTITSTLAAIARFHGVPPC